MVSGTVSLSLSECFSPFPHGTCSLSVSSEYLALPDGPGGQTAPGFAYGALTLYGRAFQPVPLAVRNVTTPALQPRRGVATATVWAPPRSLATTWGIIRLFSTPRGTKMFQFPRFAPGTAAIRPSLLSNSRRDRSTSDVHVLGGVKDTAETLSFLTYKSCL